MYVLTENGHGNLVRPMHFNQAGDRIACVRTSTGAWVSGKVLRTWTTEKAADRDRYSPQMRWENHRRLDYKDNYGANIIEVAREQTVTPGHPTLSGAGYNCDCGECAARWSSC